MKNANRFVLCRNLEKMFVTSIINILRQMYYCRERERERVFRVDIIRYHGKL